MGSSTKEKRKIKPAEDPRPRRNTTSSDASASLGQESDYSYSAPKDMRILKFNVNGDGVGQILLPPSLSILLQSDRIFISPFAGGLLIRSE
jgi:hypothetical protein